MAPIHHHFEQLERVNRLSSAGSPRSVLASPASRDVEAVITTPLFRRPRFGIFFGQRAAASPPTRRCESGDFHLQLGRWRVSACGNCRRRHQPPCSISPASVRWSSPQCAHSAPLFERLSLRIAGDR
jgi:hypothetical protein